MKMAFIIYSRCDRIDFLLTNKQAEKARVPVHSSVHLLNGICWLMIQTSNQAKF